MRTLARFALLVGLTAPLVAPAYAQAPADQSVRVGTLEVRDVSLGSAEQGMAKIGRINFLGFTRAGGTVQAERVEVENLTFDFKGRTLDIPSVRLRGFSAPEEVFRAVTEGAQVQSLWSELIGRMVIEEITVDTMTDRMNALAYEQRMSGLRLTGLRDGVVASMRMTGSEGGMQRPDNAERIRIRTGEVRYDEFNVVESMRYVVGGGSGTTRQLLRQAVAVDFEMMLGAETMRMARMEVAGVHGRAPTNAPPFMDPDFVQKLDGGDPEALRTFGTYLGDLFTDFRVDRYAIEGIEFRFTGGAFRQAGLFVNGLTGKGIESFELRGTEVDTPAGSGRLQRYAVQRINYEPLLRELVAMLKSGKPDEQPTPQQVLNMIPRYASVGLAGLDVQIPGAPFSIGSFDIEMDDQSAIPRTLAIVLKRLRAKLDASIPNELVQRLIALGYGDIAADAETRFRLIPEQKAFLVENMSMLIDRVGQVEMSARIGNLDIERITNEAISGNQSSAAIISKSALLESVELRIANLGVAERLYAEIARGAGISPDAIREGFAAEMRAQAIAALGSSASPASIDALSRFVRAPDKLVVRITPRRDRPPLSFGELERMGPPETIDRVAIEITTTSK